jgi:integrase
MASVAKDPRGKSPYWYACYTDAFGRRLKKSTGLTAKSKALEMARALQKAADEARRGALTEARTRELLSEVLQSVQGEGLRVFSVAEWFDHFVKGKRKSRSDKTAVIYEQTKKEFLEFLGPRARLNIAAITSRDIAEFRDRRQAKGLAPATLNLDITILSAAFNAAWKQGHISVNPCLAVEPIKDRAQRKAVFSPEQVSALVKAAPSGDWKGLILAGFYLGARLSDCANLRWKDIDLVPDIKTIRFIPRKGGGEVVTVVHPALEDFLLSMRTPDSDEAFVFPTLAQRNASSLSNAFRKIMDRAGIEHREIRKRISKDGRSVAALSFHSLRHSFATTLANAGIPEELRMLLTGHSARDIHQRYSHHDLEALRDAVAVLPRIK